MKKMCTIEGLRMTFQPQPQVSIGMGVNNELYTQVEIDGDVWGKGVGMKWDEAKMQIWSSFRRCMN
ncbi:putative protein-serine/threonine phosphatase [Helianthus annuus]|nr:putative protein-serine/threonine phosphatase [Helianthus annuus]